MSAIMEEVPGLIQVYADGTVMRFNLDRVISPGSSSPVSADGFLFRDVVVDASKPITARIFVPSDFDQESQTQLPLVVYFHGGGFCFCSTTWSGYHAFLGGLCARSRCIVFSVEYRLAPEHRLPVPYDDSFAALEWLAIQTKHGGDPWLQKVELSRVFLAGESAGGNIAHHVTLRLLQEPVGRLGARGLVIIHPFFGGQERTEEEKSAEKKAHLHATDTLWRLSLPVGADRDHHFSNFANAEVPEDLWREFPKVIVFVAGKDLLKPRGMAYGAFVESKGAKEVAVVTAEEEVHAYHVFLPSSEATKLLQAQIAEFMNNQ